MKTLYFNERPILYDGSPLSSHWIFKTFGIEGNALVSFVGPCQVSLKDMVDLADVVKNAPIFSHSMLHFIGEWFIDNLELGILYQHHLASIIAEVLFKRDVRGFQRKGNDLYQDGRKLNVSICTRSPVSTLVHFGVNISSKETPVPTVSLEDLCLDPESLAHEALQVFSNDYGIWKNARVKVRSVS